jgi:hypothetical protein
MTRKRCLSQLVCIYDTLEEARSITLGKLIVDDAVDKTSHSFQVTLAVVFAQVAVSKCAAF